MERIRRAEMLQKQNTEVLVLEMNNKQREGGKMLDKIKIPKYSLLHPFLL